MSGPRVFLPVILLVLAVLVGVFAVQFLGGRQGSEAGALEAEAIQELTSSIETSVAASVEEKMEVYLEQLQADAQPREPDPFPTEELTTAIIAKLEQAMATGEMQLREPATADPGGEPAAAGAIAEVAAIEFPDQQEPMELAAERELQQIHFVYDSAELTPGAQRKTRLAAEAIVEEQPSKVQVQGFSDTAGDPDYNEALSQRRAASVAKLLIAAGVPADIIEIRAMGESVLPEPTGDGVEEPLNRCVSITAIR